MRACAIDKQAAPGSLIPCGWLNVERARRGVSERDEVDSDKLDTIYTIRLKCPECGEWLTFQKLATTETPHTCPICQTFFEVEIKVRYITR